MLLESLFKTLQERKRPEDVAQLILEIAGKELRSDEKTILLKAARNALKHKMFAYTSMREEFLRPVGLQRQVAKAVELFSFPEPLTSEQCDDPIAVEKFITLLGETIKKSTGANDFQADRLNTEARKEAGLQLSRRRYNKLFRHLLRMESKLQTLLREWKKYELTVTGKSGLASQLAWTDFSSDVASACFIAYFTARSNLRSEFTISGQQRPYDEIAAMLLKRCLPETANWLAIACVYPHESVIAQLSDLDKGVLLGRWYSVLQQAGTLLEETWQKSDINRETMVVRRGNDSSTWNNTANAWNKARDNWITLLYALQMDSLLDVICPGKVLRLMAADVAYWHIQSGNGMAPDTLVWRELPLPWEVISGRAESTRQQVEQICLTHGVDTVKSGWIGPRPRGTAVNYRPTPELVHGVTVSNPFLATLLRKTGYFSGKTLKPIVFLE